MTNTPFPLDEFYSRIGVQQKNAQPTLEHLEQLQQASICAIPFENFDIQLGRGIHLDMPALIDKIIRKKRGGYCFELNAIFLAALLTEGFSARAILARVHLTGEPTGRTHQALLVNIHNEDFLVDVGFGGGCPRVPLSLTNAGATNHNGILYRLQNCEFGTMLQSKEKDKEWNNLYSFDLTPVLQSDIEIANHFTSTHPDSLFTKSRVAVKSFLDGEIRLLNFRSTATIEDQSETRELPDSETYLQVLSEMYDIELDAEYSDLVPIHEQ